MRAPAAGRVIINRITEKSMLLRALLFLSAASLAAAASAADPQLQPLPDAAPPPPPTVHSGETLEPDVTIVQKQNETVEEYRVHGRLYMVKVTPKIGKPYYLLDTNGDGMFNRRMSDMYSDFVVPQWVLFSW